MGETSAPPDVVSLTAEGTRFSGWQSLRITRGIERMPSDFLLAATEKFPGAADVVVRPGAPCEVRIGADLLISGYIDRYDPSISPKGHDVRISGRGKCADLVDCSLLFDGNQLSQVSVIDLARKLAEPYGVAVRGPADAGKVIGQINLLLGETPFEVIERVTRWARLLAYEGTDGDLVLASVGAEKHAGGFREGANVQAASASWGMDQRYGEYVGYVLSSNSLSDLAALQGKPADTGNKKGEASDPEAAALRRADGKPRLRRKVIISEQFDFNLGYLAGARAQWEMQRRWGRGQAVRLTVDSWRDPDGRLWEPNRLATVHLPSLKIHEAEWLIAEVSFIKAEQVGTVAEVLLMPKAAFEIEPTSLQPVFGDVARALEHGNPTGTGEPLGSTPTFNPTTGRATGPV